MSGQEDAANRAISGLMSQGALEEAGAKGYRLVVQRTPHTHLREAFFELYQQTQISGVIFGSYGVDKLLRRIVGLGLPALLLDHDLHLARVNSSARRFPLRTARRAVQYLASIGHRAHRVSAHWQQNRFESLATARLPRGTATRICHAIAAGKSSREIRPKPAALPGSQDLERAQPSTNGHLLFQQHAGRVS